MACDQKAANRAVARVIPVILGLIIIYACWVFTKSLCIDYLLQSKARNPRNAVSIGLLVAFYILLIGLLVSYLRLLAALIWNLDYVPRGPQYAESQATAESSKGKSVSRKRRQSIFSRSKTDEEWHDLGEVTGNHGKSAYPFDASGLEAFYLKDVYVCKEDGKPPWCSTCQQFKSDRVHHCREIGRCVRKMDHFCPWVGGVVSETSFKFFIQFLFYAVLFTTFNLVVMAVFVAEHRNKNGKLIVHWILILAVSSLFGLFALGMLGSSIQLACLNSSTIENLDRRAKVWTLAILIPPSMEFTGENAQTRLAPTFPIVSFSTPFGSSLPMESTANSRNSELPRRNFAILHTKPGENPWDLGSPLANLKEVMGYSFLDWISPLKKPPCTDHSRQESAYRLGHVVQRLRSEAGFDPPVDEMKKHRNRGKRKRSYRRTRTLSSREQRSSPDTAQDIHSAENSSRERHQNGSLEYH
ncbi:hypothetical protein PABG_03893 [Paracoccidioides brasiliensis Pb03]|nr:hypothetical protein PABG_03893 [Paracoccidioides brasiliensis Pb03]